MVATPHDGGGGGGGDGDDDDDEENVLDMPPSWVGALSVRRWERTVLSRETSCAASTNEIVEQYQRIRGANITATTIAIPTSRNHTTDLQVARNAFRTAYPPHGQRTVLYLKAKLELFAEHVHDQGMVSRLTLYKVAHHPPAHAHVCRAIEGSNEGRTHHCPRRAATQNRGGLDARAARTARARS